MSPKVELTFALTPGQDGGDINHARFTKSVRSRPARWLSSPECLPPSLII